jgi:hypothetical protein
MGQAKKKGTFEQRQQAAYDRKDALVSQQAENLKRLEEADKQSEERVNAMLQHFVGKSLKDLERQLPYMSVDYTQVEAFGSVRESETIRAERKKIIEADLAAM